jgi:RNA polymerase sigma-70 factor, ECF subfamily
LGNRHPWPAMDEPRTDLGSLIRDARRGDSEARDRLLEAFRNYLRLLARTGIDASLREKADASDVVQETLLKAHKNFAQFHGQTEAELATWLRQILANCLTDLFRRFRVSQARQVARERSLEEVLDHSSLALSRLVAAPGLSPSENAERRETSVVLADALADLSDDYREVIMLRSLEERDWDAVARIMGRSNNAVRMLWARALKRLRPLIEKRL